MLPCKECHECWLSSDSKQSIAVIHQDVNDTQLDCQVQYFLSLQVRDKHCQAECAIFVILASVTCVSDYTYLLNKIHKIATLTCKANIHTIHSD